MARITATKPQIIAPKNENSPSQSRKFNCATDPPRISNTKPNKNRPPATIPRIAAFFPSGLRPEGRGGGYGC